MNYQEALEIIIAFVKEQYSIEVQARTLLNTIRPLDVDSINSILKNRLRRPITGPEFLECETIEDLANQIVSSAKAIREDKARLAQSKGDEPEPEGSEYPVWFGTNRRPRNDANGIKFTSKRDGAVHHGRCTVFVPESHKIGSLGSSWWKRWTSNEDDRLRITRIDRLAEQEYWSAIRQALEDVAPDDRDAVLFIHGYNVSFSEAALRAAQLGFDLGVRGAMAFFSWPSQGRLSGYLADEATMEVSESAISAYLTDFATKSGANQVHLIVHSMGNRAVLRAINRITAEAATRSSVKFSQIILAAPDLDSDFFYQYCDAYRALSKRTTLYVSTTDHAVGASSWLHSFPRVGLAPPVCVVSGIDTINVTNVDLTMLGHGYIAEARGILQDIYNVFAHNTPPERRFGLREALTDDGKKYWIVGE